MISVRITKTTRIRTVICQLTANSTIPRQIETTISVASDKRESIKVKVFGMSLSVILKTVGISAPR